MAKRKQNAQMPVTGGVRRRRNTAPAMATDGSLIKYNVQGSTLATGSVSSTILYDRYYVPGFTTALVNPTGPDLVASYSTGKFEPGCKIRWEPAVSFSTAGRVYVGFTDNPEVIAAIFGLTGQNRVDAIKSLGSTVSFPVWQETEVNFPSRTRRKRFDCNSTVVRDAIDVLDRSCQCVMFCALEGSPVNTTLGNFWFHDRVSVEGLHGLLT